MHRVIHFEMPADEPERALRFYADVFGWRAQKWDGPVDYWFITTGPDGQPGIDGGLVRRSPSGGSMTNTIEVESVDEYVARIQEHGGQVVRPKMPVPGIGYLAYCRDTEGNEFGIIEMDPPAA